MFYITITLSHLIHSHFLLYKIMFCCPAYLYTVVVGVVTFSLRMRHLNLLYYENNFKSRNTMLVAAHVNYKKDVWSDRGGSP